MKNPFRSHPLSYSASPLAAALRAAALGLALVSPLTATAQTSASAGNAAIGGIESLEKFVKGTQSGRAAFTQVVTAPAREGQTPRTKTSTGTFEFSRPNRFRFVYIKPFEQRIVADGQTLWLHDLDLNQVTARKLSQVLNGTPAAVIAAAADLKDLQADFKLRALPDQDGLQWVEATPKTTDGQLQRIRVAFRVTAQGSELAALDILDSFGQRSRMSFTQFEVNPALAASTFQFTPPAGADVIRQ